MTPTGREEALGSPTSSTACACSLRCCRRREARPSSCRARIAAARSAAFTAPARPIASVPTGTPAGICTVERSESSRRAPSTRPARRARATSVFDATIPGEVRRSARARDDHLQASLLLGLCVRELERLSGVRCAETHPRSRAERPAALERLRRVPHRLPVGAGAHDDPDDGDVLAHPRLLRRLLLEERVRRSAPSCGAPRPPRPTPAIPSRICDRVALRRPVAQADHREPPHRRVRVARRELVQERTERVDVARVVAREALERDERRAARGRALVLEPAPEELDLLRGTGTGRSRGTPAARTR